MIRNKSNFFRLIEVSTEKRTENICNNAQKKKNLFLREKYSILRDSFLNLLTISTYPKTADDCNHSQSSVGHCVQLYVEQLYNK